MPGIRNKVSLAGKLLNQFLGGDGDGDRDGDDDNDNDNNINYC